MTAKERVKSYLEYCQYRKELDEKTLKAYKIDLRQYIDFFHCENLEKKRLGDI